MNRSETLDKAKACVCGQRERTNTALRKIISPLLLAFGASIKALNSLQMMLP